MELRRHHLRILRQWREALPKPNNSRKELAKKISAGSKPPLHELTLYKREKGILQVSDEDLKKWLDALDNRKIQDLEREATKLRELKLAVSPYPDFIFFTLAGGDEPCSDLPEWEPLAAIPVPTNFPEIPSKLEKGHLDAALFGEDAYRRLPPNVKTKLHVVGPALRFRGYAILTTNDSDLISFGEAFRKTEHHAPDQRIGLTIAHVFHTAAMCSAELLVPVGTTMHFLINQLLTIAISYSPRENVAGIEKLKNSLKNSEDDVKTFQHFVTRLNGQKPTKPALFFGGLSHRLLAEDAGAATLFSNDDLGKIAHFLPSVRSELFGKNLLIVSQTAREEMSDDLTSLIHNWNALSSAVEHRENAAQDVSKLIQDGLKKFPVPEPASTASTLAEFDGHFERAVREVMIQFFHLDPKALQLAPTDE